QRSRVPTLCERPLHRRSRFIIAPAVGYAGGSPVPFNLHNNAVDGGNIKDLRNEKIGKKALRMTPSCTTTSSMRAYPTPRPTFYLSFDGHRIDSSAHVLGYGNAEDGYL